MKLYTILAVDDQTEYLQSYAAYFFEENVPYKIISAVHGEMALELAAAEHPDVIIMDWQMPVMDGLTAVKILKADDSLRDIPIIMASGIMLSSEDLRDALAAGASDFIRKPIERTELMARVGSHLKMADYIQELKEHERVRDAEREEKANQLKASLHSACEQMQEMAQFFLKEYEQLQAELNRLNKEPANHSEIIKGIKSVLVSNTKAFRNYTSACKQFMAEDDFIRRLLVNHPDLLPKEIELILLLKKNTASKDIAAMTFRSVNTIKVARSKLRSKLGLKQSDNLVNYLLQL
jgi:DNA-binding response OmpR family regulator/DNA-binding CsgD family transcriptional regulator